MTVPGDGRNRRDLFLIRESPEERFERVERLKAIVAGGCYHVPFTEVADAVVAFFRRPEDWAGVGNAAADDDSC